MILVYIINGKPVNFGMYIFEIRFLPSCNINLVLLTPQNGRKVTYSLDFKISYYSCYYFTAS